MTEEREPAELVAQLNEYLGAMVRCVFENNGTVDKFIGDAMLAVWGNLRDISPEEAARSAFNCARQMRRELDRLNTKWQREKRPTFKQGIGVHYGDAIVGNLGSPEKMEFAMIGDAVNSASRIEGLTKAFGSELIISDEIAKLLEVDDKPMLKPLPFIQVKGRSKSLTLYEVVRSGNISLWESYKDEYLIALKSFTDGEFEEAVHYFDRCRAAAPTDGAVTTVLEGAQAFVRQPPKKWRGVIVMNSK
jgi:adenylate cyclase